jgi:hypothetical protein
MLNNASVRGRTIRCIFVSDLETMRQTMCGGQRLFVDGIDAALETRGLLDVASLFGDVLDCKVEPVNGSVERQTAVGFVHYAKLEASDKARTLLSGMQIGEATVKVRPFVAKDLDVFTGCLYAAGCFDEEVDIDEPSQAANGVEGAVASSSMDVGSSNGDGYASRPLVVATAPVFATDADELEALEHFKALQYHVMEVCADRKSKLTRLQELVTLYSPNHEQQMIVTAGSDSLDEITGVLSETFDEYDFAVVGECASLEDRSAIAREFDTGNIYVLVMDEAVFSHTSIGVTEPSAVFVAFDLPETVQEYLSEIWVYTRPHTSRIHGFFSPGVNTALCGPILALMEEADLEIDPKLLELLGDESSKCL